MYSYPDFVGLVQCIQRWKRCSYFLLAGFVLGAFNRHVAYTAELPFQTGESLTYHVGYFGIHAGTAVMEVDRQVHTLNGYPCYRFQVTGTSSKGLSLLGFNIANRWESYVDIEQLWPHKFLAHIQENNYSRNEIIDFDYQRNQARIEVAESSYNGRSKVAYYAFTQSQVVHDIVSVYYALRAMDTAKLKPGDAVSLHFILSDQVKPYVNEGTVFLGKKTIATPLGSIQTIVFAPIIPTEGTIFSGKRPVELFIADDPSKIPVKIKINLVVGAVEIDLANYKGVKDRLDFQTP